MIGRLSGWGWGLGYAGGLLCLVVALVVLVQPDPPLFGLDKESGEPVRATSLLVAGWFAVFSLPFFLVVPDVPGKEPFGCRGGAPGTGRAGRDIPENPSTFARSFTFLIARMIYTDGIQHPVQRRRHLCGGDLRHGLSTRS